MKVVDCTHESHALQILDVFNDAILTSTALFDYKPRAPESMIGWFEAKERGHYPVVGLENDTGQLVAFASFGVFRAWPAYKYSVEHSVYVHKDHRGQGFGRTVLNELIGRARKQDYHLMIGGIEAGNAPSIALHESLGFQHAGTIRQAGYKFGRWLDLAFYQLTLPTPATPSDA
jgi:L-amino acid N-acyltransferase